MRYLNLNLKDETQFYNAFIVHDDSVSSNAHSAFQLMSNFNLLDTYFALIVPQLCFPFAIFLLRQNFLAFPTELIEAARLDGAGEMRIF